MEEKPTMGNTYLTLNERNVVLKISSEGEGDAGFQSFIEKNLEDLASKQPIPDHLFVKVNFRDKKDIPHILSEDPDRFVNQLIPLMLEDRCRFSQGKKMQQVAFAKKYGLNYMHEDYWRKMPSDPRYEEFVREFCRAGDKTTLAAVETGEGTLIFSYTEIGKKAQFGYLQELADRFYSEFYSDKPVRIYSFSTRDKELIGAADSSIIYLDRDDKYEKSPLLQYSQTDFRPDPNIKLEGLYEAYCVAEYSMNPDYKAFEEFTGRNKLFISSFNMNLSALQRIADKGYNNSNMFKDSDNAGYRALGKRFGDAFDKRIYDSTTIVELGKIITESKAMASEILQKEFRYRGQDRSNEQRTDITRPARKNQTKPKLK